MTCSGNETEKTCGIAFPFFASFAHPPLNFLSKNFYYPHSIRGSHMWSNQISPYYSLSCLVCPRLSMPRVKFRPNQKEKQKEKRRIKRRAPNVTSVKLQGAVINPSRRIVVIVTHNCDNDRITPNQLSTTTLTTQPHLRRSQTLTKKTKKAKKIQTTFWKLTVMNLIIRKRN